MSPTYLLTERRNDYATVVMNRPKVNAINAQMVQEIRETFQELEADDSVQGVILTGMPGVFSAGLDLIELYDYDRDTMHDFFIAFSRMHVELVQFSKPFICALSGHSPAGGTVIAIAADYRVMAEDERYGIGLNEVAVNVQISDNLIEAYNFWLGRSRSYQNILAGNLLNPQQALAQGLVDDVCPADQVLSRAKKRMEHYLTANPSILRNTKAKLRKDWLARIAKEDKKELQQTETVWWSPEVRERMQQFIYMLQSRKKMK